MTPEERDKTPCYIAVKSCGCVVAAIVDDGTRPKDTAKAISDWVRRGAVVERKTVEWVRENMKFCDHHKKV